MDSFRLLPTLAPLLASSLLFYRGIEDKKMKTSELEDALVNLLCHFIDEEEIGLKSVRTFKECGVLTTDNGLVLRALDNSEFQITIVKSR